MYDGSYILVVAPLIEYFLVVVPSSFSNIFFLFELHVYSLILLTKMSEHKLFVGMLPKNVSDAEVSALFSEYGTIRDLQILRGSQLTSKGECLVISLVFPFGSSSLILTFVIYQCNQI